MIICLDPGHTKGANIGHNRDYREGTAMFTLAKKLKAALEAYDGVEVILTRSLTENPSLEARGAIAKKAKCALMLSLHSNAFSKSTACGVSAFYSYKRDSKPLAEALAKAVAADMKTDTAVTYSRGAKTRTYVGKTDGKTYDYYGVIRSSVSNKAVDHAIILEHGFHTHPAECQFLMQDANLDRLAATDAAVIADFFGLKKPAAKPPAAKPPATKPSADTWAVGDIVSIRPEATVYGTKAVALPSGVKREHLTVAAIGGSGKTAGKLRLLEVNTWIDCDLVELVRHGGWTMFAKGDAVRVSGTSTWVSGAKMASWVRGGVTLYIHSLRQNGAIAVIGKKVAGRIAVTGTVYTKYLKKV